MPELTDHDRLVKQNEQINSVCKKLDFISKTLEEIREEQTAQKNFCLKRGDYNANTFLPIRLFFWIIPMMVIAVISIGTLATGNKMWITDHQQHYEDLIEGLDDQKCIDIEFDEEK